MNIENLKNNSIVKVLAVVIVLLLIIAATYGSKGNMNSVSNSLSSSTVNTNNTSAGNNSGVTSNKQGTTVTKVVTSSNGKCGFSVTYPTSGTRVAFPLTVKGIIDQVAGKKSGCTWKEVNSIAGTAQLFYNQNGMGWRSQGIPVSIMTEGQITASSSSFFVNLNFLNAGVGLKSGTPMKITFVENNALGITNPETFDLYVSFK